MPLHGSEGLADRLRPFAPCFTAAVWRHVLVLVAGALLAPGRRTVTAALRIMGLDQAPGFAVYHRVLSLGRWSSRAVAHRLLVLLVAALTLWATQTEATQRLLPACVRWYPKHAPTFSDALALVRRELWTSPTFAASPDYREVPKLSANVLNRLLLVACRPP